MSIPFPFTFSMLALVAVTGILTGTHRGPLPDVWLQRFGFAPRDLWEGKPLRLFLSVFAVESGPAFWQALGMIAVAVGGVEYLLGTGAAAVIFWGAHLATILLTSLVVAWPLHRFRLPFARGLLLIRDVGASAGYFGCLGAIMPVLGKFSPWLRGLAPLILLVLTVVFFRTLRRQPSADTRLYSDLCHAVAFALGWGLLGLR